MNLIDWVAENNSLESGDIIEFKDGKKVFIGDFGANEHLPIDILTKEIVSVDNIDDLYT